MGGWDKSDDNGGHAGVHYVGISSIVISMLIDDTLILVTVKLDVLLYYSGENRLHSLSVT